MLKKILKKIYISRPIYFLTNILGFPWKGRGAILMYHRILPEKLLEKDLGLGLAVSCENFEKQILALKSKYKIVSMDTFLENIRKKNSEFMIAITFDDGYKDNFTYAFPILKKHKIPALIYVTTNFLNKEVFMWWYELKDKILNSNKLHFEHNQERYMFNFKNNKERLKTFKTIRKIFLKMNLSEQIDFLEKITGYQKRKDYSDICLKTDELKSLDQSPLITIGSHTHTHPNLKNIDSDEIKKEIDKSIYILENLLNHKIKHFSYPYGGKNEVSLKEIETIKKLTFDSAVTTLNYPTNDKNIFSLPRLYVGNDTCGKTLINHLTGFYNLFNFLFK